LKSYHDERRASAGLNTNLFYGSVLEAIAEDPDLALIILTANFDNEVIARNENGLRVALIAQETLNSIDGKDLRIRDKVVEDACGLIASIIRIQILN